MQGCRDRFAIERQPGYISSCPGGSGDSEIFQAYLLYVHLQTTLRDWVMMSEVSKKMFVPEEQGGSSEESGRIAPDVGGSS